MTNSFSLGNVLTALTVVVAAAVAWGAQRQETTALSERLQQATVSISAHEARLRALEVTTARVETRIDAILQGIERIETRLERTEQP